MSGAALTFEIHETAIPVLERAAVRALDARRLLDNIGAFLDSDVIRRFIAGTAPDGSKWKPSQSALQRGGRTLIASGNLMAGVTHNLHGDDAVDHGLTAIYGAIQHFGGETGRNYATKIEARTILGIAASQEARIDRMVTGFTNTWFQ